MALIVNDISAYQNSDLDYFKKLKDHDSRGAVVKLTEGTEYLNARASAQIRNALKTFGSVSVYHFLDGGVSALAQARYFCHWMKAFGLDKSTVWALDVEAYNLPWNCDYMIDVFINYMKSHGYPTGKVVYGSASWFNEGRINRRELDTDKIWVAAYGTNEPGVNDAQVWQFTDNFAHLNTDASLDFDHVFVPVSKPKPYKQVAKAPVRYWHKTGKYVVTSSVNVYKDLHDKHSMDVHLDKGSTFKADQVLTVGKATRLHTDVGYISANSKFVRPIK